MNPQLIIAPISFVGMDPKYLTTVIPYNLDNGSPDNQALQVLIKSKYNGKVTYPHKPVGAYFPLFRDIVC